MTLFNPGQLASRLCSQWSRIPQLNGRPEPPVLGLAGVLEIAYSASMEVDEGRSLKFGLLLMDIEEARSDNYTLLEFDDRRRLSVAEIKRLSSATGLSSTFIGIDFKDGHSAIWGVVDVGHQWRLMQDAERSGGASLPLSLVILSRAPGTISLKFSDSLIQSVERGQAAHPASNVLKFGPVFEFFRPAILSFLATAHPNWAGGDSDRFFFYSYGGEYLRFVARTLRYTEAFGHGGTVLVIREDDVEKSRNLLSYKYSVTDCDIWGDLLRYSRNRWDEIESFKKVTTATGATAEEFSHWNKARVQGEKIERQLIDNSRFLSRLTQVDGALVLTDKFRVLGFGAIILPEGKGDQKFRLCYDEVGKDSLTMDYGVYGTRHRSAIEFCKSIDSVAFIISQDGAVKAVRKTSDEMYVWPSILLSPPAWFVTAEDMIDELRPDK